MIRAVIFDFDGLILDTETPAFESWREIYAEFGQELRLDQWESALGRAPGQGFDALAYLAGVVPQPFDQAALLERRMARKHQLAEALPLLPGVVSLLDQAEALGLPCAVASSSGRSWVEHWLRRHGLFERFACLRTLEDVAAAKPAPDLFLSAAACLDVPPVHCLVFEDSPNGVLAAAAAGMRCVVVPGPITAQARLPPADLRLASLADCSLADLLERWA